MKENKSENKVDKKRVITYIFLVVIAVYLLYTVYMLIKEPTKMVTVENRKIIYGRN